MFKKPANNTVITPVAYAGGATFGSTDNLGRLRVSRHQNIYEADFEYGTQPMRWENYIASPTVALTITGSTGNVVATSSVTGNVAIGMPVTVSTATGGTINLGAYVVAVNTSGGGANSITLSKAPSATLTGGSVTVGGGSSVAQLPGTGGVRMRLSQANGDVTIRQTRPYHRYQPGKTMVMSTALNFGTAQVGQRQRVGFFDDGNGIFLEQGDPIYTARTDQITGTIVANTNYITLTGGNTANCYVGMPVWGNGINQTYLKTDPNGNINIPANTYVTNIINSTAVAISSAATNTYNSSTYSFYTAPNPFGMYTVIRSDVNSAGVQNHGTSSGAPTDYRIPLPVWNGDQATIQSIDWSRIQMVWQEYTWYGAGMARWGVVINGEWIVLNYVGFGNKGPLNTTSIDQLQSGQVVFPAQVSPWSRTGNLPVRYEQRNVAATTAQNDMYHWGVSVIVEGGQDDQRGFTYSYGMNPAAQRTRVGGSGAVTRYPVLSIAARTMGVIEMSGNGSFNALSAATSNSITLTTPNTTFDGVQSSALVCNLQNGNNVVTVTNGPIANVFVGQVATSTTSGIGAGSSSVITYVNSSAFVLAAPFGGTTTTGAAVNTYTANSFIGRHIYFPAQGGTSNTGLVGRITSSNSTVITFGDIVTGKPLANATALTTTGYYYQIGLLNRGQLLPKTLVISADNTCIIELISSTTASPILLTGAQWNTLANLQTTSTFVGTVAQANGLVFANGGTVNTSGLGSNNSFAMRDVSATAMNAGGEVVFAFSSPAGGSGLQTIDLSYFFPLYNTVSGNLPDILTVAVTTTGSTGANVGVHIIAQEAMS